MNERSGICLFLWLCAATFCFESISGVGFELLEIPLKCYMRLNFGDGQQAVSRYFYNPKNSQCRRFAYTGQNGNGNNFKSLKECIQVCKGWGTEEEDAIAIAQNLILNTKAPFLMESKAAIVSTTTPVPSKKPSVQAKRARNKIKNTLNKLLTEWTRYFRMILS